MKKWNGPLEQYIESHIDAIYEKDQKTGRTSWDDDESEGRFERILTGSKSEFLDATRELSERMAQRIDGRMRSGFLVTARRKFEGEMQAAVLKLDKKDGAVAHTKKLREGKYDLSIVRELLDAPRDLQKGAVYPDGRSDSAAVVGEKHRQTAYFLDVLGLKQVYTEKESTKEFVQSVISSLPPLKAIKAVDKIFSEGKKVSSTTLINKLQNIADEKERAKIKTAIKKKPKALSKFNPKKAPMRLELKFGEIVIIAPPGAWSDQIEVNRDKKGTWKISISTETPPKLTAKK